MQVADSTALDSSTVPDGSTQPSVALAVWGLTMTMLLGAVVVAGLAMTGLRLQMRLQP